MFISVYSFSVCSGFSLMVPDNSDTATGELSINLHNTSRCILSFFKNFIVLSPVGFSLPVSVPFSPEISLCEFSTLIKLNSMAKMQSGDIESKILTVTKTTRQAVFTPTFTGNNCYYPDIVHCNKT